MVEVGFEVFHVLDAHGQPDELFGDAFLLSSFRAQFSVGGMGW